MFNVTRKTRSLFFFLALGVTFYALIRLQPEGYKPPKRSFYIHDVNDGGEFVLHDDNLGIRMFAIVGSAWQSLSHQSVVTLCTQGNLDYMGNLPYLGSRWKGPMSIAIYVPGIDWDLTRMFVEHLNHCYPEMVSRTNYQLLPFPNSAPFSPKPDCRSSKQVLKEILSHRTAKHEEFIANDSYPYNIMRNVARDGVLTSFILMSDVDHVPNENIFDTLEDFIRQERILYGKKRAYVIPQYELNRTKGATIPRDKSELLELKRRNLSGTMYEEFFPQFQHCIKTKLWETINGTNESAEPGLAMQVNFSFSCEMTLVHKATDPYFDERFRGYGCDRFSQMLELYAAKFRFDVFTSLFFVHLGRKGLQDTKGHKPKKLAELRQNQKRMVTFIEDLNEKYQVNTCQMIGKDRAWMGVDVPWTVLHICPSITRPNQTQH
ncbi:beta-1,4-glucuronyltransferase 1-like [Tigriopus californicus]|uniref:beta-1,4-glucuronyltransferase 1-like n=1 Tax=Tigriopus californicus TaxID=6832 RepID=UPI0027DAB32B|nr:beta-1,4-glucuronyltransferase 1-like [Tigriopus californicus]